MEELDDPIGAAMTFAEPPAPQPVSGDEALTEAFKQTAPFPEEHRQIQYQRAREQVAQQYDPDANWTIRKAFAFPRDIITNVLHGQASRKIQAGTATEQDYKTAAEIELERESDARRAQSIGGAIGQAAMSLPSEAVGFLAGAKLAGPVTSALGMGGAGVGPMLGRTAVGVAATPNLGLASVIRQNVEHGRDPFDIQGVPAGGGLSFAEMAMMGAVAKVAGLKLPDNVFGQAIASGLSMPIGQQLVDLAAHGMGLKGDYGTAQQIMEGRYGEAARDVLTQVFTGVAFSLLHGGDSKYAKERLDRFGELLNEEMGRPPEPGGLPPGPQPEPPPGGAPGGARRGGRRRGARREEADDGYPGGRPNANWTEDDWIRYEHWKKDEGFGRGRRRTRAEREEDQRWEDFFNESARREKAKRDTGRAADRLAREVLGVDENATPEQIANAWREFQKKEHPDRGGTHDRFTFGSWAYDFLSGKRVRGQAPSPPGQAWPPPPPPEAPTAPPGQAQAPPPPPPPRRGGRKPPETPKAAPTAPPEARPAAATPAEPPVAPRAANAQETATQPSAAPAPRAAVPDIGKPVKTDKTMKGEPRQHFTFDVGEKPVDLRVVNRGDSLEVEWMGFKGRGTGEKGEGSMRAADIKAVAQQLFEQNPEAERITSIRGGRRMVMTRDMIVKPPEGGSQPVGSQAPADIADDAAAPPRVDTKEFQIENYKVKRGVPIIAYRGVQAGRHPRNFDDTIGKGIFYSPVRAIAEAYAAGRTKMQFGKPNPGFVVQDRLTFNKVLRTRTWVKAKEKLGLPPSAELADLMEAASKAGYDGIVYGNNDGVAEIIALPGHKSESPMGLPKPASKLDAIRAKQAQQASPQARPNVTQRPVRVEPKPPLAPRGVRRQVAERLSILGALKSMRQNRPEEGGAAANRFQPKTAEQQRGEFLERVLRYRIESFRDHIKQAHDEPTPENIARVTEAVERLAKMAETRQLNIQQLAHEKLPELHKLLRKLLKNPKDVPHNQEVKDAIAKAQAVAKGLGLDPKTVQRRIEASLARETLTATEPEVDDAAVEGPLSPAERRRLNRQRGARKAKITKALKKITPLEFEEKAIAAGLDPEELHQRAEYLVEQDREMNEGPRAVYAHGMELIRKAGYNAGDLARFAGDDWNKIKGFDGIARSVASTPEGRAVLGDLINESGGSPEESAADALWEFLQRGEPQSLSLEDAYDQALRIMEENKDAVNATNQQLRRAGLAPLSDADIERAEEQAQRELEEESKAIRDEGPADAGDFNPAEFDAPAGADRGLWDAAKDFLTEEGGFFDPAQFLAGVKARYQQLLDATQKTRDAIGRIGGKMYPATTRLDRASGEALARFSAVRTYAREAGEYYIDKVTSPDFEGKRLSDKNYLLAGAILTERRLRYIRQQYAERADQLRDDAANAQDQVERQRLQAEAKVAEKIASKVSSVVGAANSPLQTEADYRNGLASPGFQKILKNWNRYMVPAMEEQFRRAKGMDPSDPIDDFTQIPGSPMNLKAVTGDEEPNASTVYIGGLGNLKNPKARKLPFSYQAVGNAEAYDIDLRNIIRNTFNRGAPIAAQADFYRTAAEAGILKWAKPGEVVTFGDRKGLVLPDVKPPRGTQAASMGQTAAHIHPELKGEVWHALGLSPVEAYQDVLNTLNQIPTIAALSSSVEAATHFANLGLGLLAPKMLRNVIPNVYRRLVKNKDARDKLLELARIGALKAPGPETGTLMESVRKVTKAVSGKEIPHTADKYDPTYWGSKAIDTLGDIMRMTATDAFDQLVAAGMVEKTDTNRRDFINSLFGQYDKKAQNGMIRWLRNTGIQPFATAASTMTARAARMVYGGGSGVRSTSAAASLRQRAQVYAKLAALFGIGAVINYLTWGRWDGSDDTPFGAIKLGVTQKGGTVYVDTLVSLLRRGLRATGLLALIEGARSGKHAGEVVDNMADQVWHTGLHTVAGPGVSTAKIALTGRNTMGVRVAEKVPEGESKFVANLKAAFGNLNPLVSALAGLDVAPDRDPPEWWVRAMKLAGPFAPKVKNPPSR